MDYYGLLFLYYLKGLSGKSILRLFFNIEAGGTEQLLPENTSTPTTTPILADIQYPDGLRTDQYFTYRETPTTISNKARIKTIKGNTLVWNQISVVPFTEVKSGVTFTRSDDRTALQMSGTSTSTIYKPFSDMAMTTVGHVYYVDKGADSTLFQLYNDNGGISTETNNRRAIGRATAQKSWYFRIPNGTTIDITAKPMIMDLTQMFGETKANEILAMETAQSGSGIAYITSLFPLPFYDYNAGTLLSFNGTGIKTVGKNLFDLSQFANGTITFADGVLNGTGAQFHTAYGTYASAKKLNNPKGSQITISFDAWTDQNATSSGNGLIIATYHYDGTHEDAMVPNATGTPRHFTLQRQDIEKIGWSYGAQGANRWHIENFQVEFGTETSYEPYTSSTLSLPISTYFSSGMKSAGTVYDELTPTKAITRIGAVDLGTLTYTRVNNKRYQTTDLANLCKWGAQGTRQLNLLCSKFITDTSTNAGTVYGGDGSSKTIYFWTNEDEYQSADAFKSAMSGVYLYYEMATSTETPITTEDANEALSLLMGKSVSSSNANQLINIITKGE